MDQYKILTINPGSTSTKVAVFSGEECLFSKNVSHESEELAKYKEISDQFEYRKEMIDHFLKESGQSLEGLSAVVGRGGGLMAVEGGVYAIKDILLEHARIGANGI